jgi:hypothetical protein
VGLGISGNAESAHGVSGRNAYRISCLYPRLPIITLPHLQTVLSERQSRTSEFRNLDTRSVCAALSYSNRLFLLFFCGVSICTLKLSFHVMTGLRGMKPAAFIGSWQCSTADFTLSRSLTWFLLTT